MVIQRRTFHPAWKWAIILTYIALYAYFGSDGLAVHGTWLEDAFGNLTVKEMSK